jgi:hypothetical protein
MHLQVKTIIPGTLFADGDVITDSATYQRGTLEHLLGILAAEGFNIRGASGRRIEFGGEFSFWVAEAGSDDIVASEEATEAAGRFLKDNGYDARVVQVSFRWLDDTTGTLAGFVADLTSKGFWVEEVTVGTPDGHGRIPVQVYSSKA